MGEYNGFSATQSCEVKHLDCAFQMVSGMGRVPALWLAHGGALKYIPLIDDDKHTFLNVHVSLPVLQSVRPESGNARAAGPVFLNIVAAMDSGTVQMALTNAAVRQVRSP